jgi:hypothetical protein
MAPVGLPAPAAPIDLDTLRSYRYGRVQQQLRHDGLPPRVTKR